MEQSRFRIVFAVYPGMTQLDFTGPHQILSRMPNSEIIVASSSGGTLAADGLTFADTRPLAATPTCDLICVPGGATVAAVIRDNDYMAELKRLAAGARYITSVCTGSLILGAAGLLEGRRAACHWAWRDLLPLFGAIPDAGRVVRDGNVITGGGVTAGIDFAFMLLAELAGVAVAQTIQLGLEYAPAPPFDAGRPETASPEILAYFTALSAQSAQRRRTELKEIATRRRRTRQDRVPTE